MSRRRLVEQFIEAGHEVHLIAPVAADDSSLHGLPVVYHPLERLSRSGKGLLQNVGLFLELRRILRRAAIETVFLFNIKPVIFGSFAARSLGITAVSTITGTGNVFLQNRFLSSSLLLLYRLALRGNRTVFLQNEDDYQSFLRLGLVRQDQTKIVGGAGVDLSQYQPVPLQNEHHFLFIGRLLEDKGIREFVDAAEQVHAQYPEARFTIVGDSDPLNAKGVTAATIAKWRKKVYLNIVGQQRDVRPSIEAATWVVLPSYQEGLPRVLLEGAAMGRPLLATDVPGCREVVQHGVNGFLVPKEDAVRLAAQMMDCLQMKLPAIAALGAAARQRVEERFSATRVNLSYLQEIGNASQN